MLFSGDVGMIRIDRSYGTSFIVGVFFSFLFFLYIIKKKRFGKIKRLD